MLFCKNILRCVLCFLFGKKHKCFYKILEKTKCEFVSFDIFDTLVERLVCKPEDVFYFLGKKYEASCGKTINFVEIRKEAEKRAYIRSKNDEITLDEIYQEIDLPAEEKIWLKKYEIELEKELCVPREEMLDVFKFALAKGKQVYLTSDIYLGKHVIEEILSKCGVKGYSNLYVSSYYGVRKNSGKLFLKLISDINIDKNNILHIGDNIVSDFLIPLKNGIKSYLLVNRKKKCRNSIDLEVIYNLIDRRKKNIDDEFVNIGNTALGPLLYGFSSWINYISCACNSKNILFLMREGLLLKRAYDIIKSDESIKTSVMYVSRISTTLPSLCEAKDLRELLDKVQARRVSFKAKELLSICSITDINVNENLELRNINEDEAAIFFNEIKDKLKEKSILSKNNILKYISNCNLEDINLVVDVGYHGTIQKNLQKLVPSKKFIGAYMGFLPEKINSIEAKGFYIKSNEDKKLYDIALSSGLFELLFLATQGTTLEYDNNGVPIIADCDNNNRQNRRIYLLQTTALEFVSVLNNLKKVVPIDVRPEEWFSFYSELVRKPSTNLVNSLIGLKFRDGRVENLLPEGERLKLLFNPILVFKRLLDSPCKIFFLKYIYRIKLPYYFVLYWMRKFDKR